MFPLSADLERAVVRVAVQLEVDRYSPEWSLASAVAGQVLASAEQVELQEHFEPLRVLRLPLG